MTAKRTARKPVAKATPATRKAPAPKPVAKAKPVPANCGCGCGQPTITSKATFLAGHDARLAGVLGRDLVLGNDAERAAAADRVSSLSPALQAKVEKIRVTAATKQARKDARGVAKAAADLAFADALAAAGV